MADGRGGRGIRLGQDIAGHGHAVRRGPAPVPRGPEHLQPPPADPGAAAGCRPDRPPAARAGPAAAPAGTGTAQHGRHHVRGAQRAPPDDVAAGLPPVPERAPRPAVDRRAPRGDHLPGMRRAFRAPQRRVLRVQLLRRLPGVPGPGRTVRSRRGHPGTRSGQDDRRRRGAAVELRRAAAVDVRRGRARGPARRPLPVTDRSRARHRAARRGGQAAGDAALGPQRAGRAAVGQLRQRGGRGGTVPAQRQRAHPPPGAAFPRHPGVLGVPWHPAAARSADFAAGRPQPRRDQRVQPGRAARVHGRPAFRASRRAQPADGRPAGRTGRQAHAAARRGTWPT